jgi:hypothetical protein
MKTKAFRKIFGTFAVLALALGAGMASRFVSAGTENGRGWLWGGGVEIDGSAPWDGTNAGVRWISMNDEDTKAVCDVDSNNFTDVSCGGLNTIATPWRTYGVDIPSGNGALSGYAWGGGDNSGPGIGWVSFNGADLSGCPSSPCSAYRQGTDIKGWARILSIRDAGVNSGGWSGWVQLDAPTAVSSGNQVRVTGSGVLSGYAYSDELGWIDFSGAVIDPVSANILQICREGIPIIQGTSSVPMTGHAFSLAASGTTNMKAYFDNDVSPGNQCDAGSNDITSSAVFTEMEGAGGEITLSGSNPIIVTAGIVPGTEDIVVSYSGQSALLNVTVLPPSCSSNCAAQAGNHCKGETFTTTNSCGNSETCTNAGTRYCDMNWKEVAPGR